MSDLTPISDRSLERVDVETLHRDFQQELAANQDLGRLWEENQNDLFEEQKLLLDERKRLVSRFDAP